MPLKFMSIYWLAFIVLLWGYFHSLFASLQFKGFVRRILGPRSDRVYRIAYNLFAVISFLAILIVAAFTPDRTLYVAPFPLVALMIIGEFLAAAALTVGLMQTDIMDFIGLRQTRGLKQKKTSKLVKDGLYRYVRHPLYTAGLAFIWLIPLMTARLLVINLALTVYVVIGAYVEESKLRQRFGSEYKDYAAMTPMFIPYINKMRRRTQTK